MHFIKSCKMSENCEFNVSWVHFQNDFNEFNFLLNWCVEGCSKLANPSRYKPKSASLSSQPQVHSPLKCIPQRTHFRHRNKPQKSDHKPIRKSVRYFGQEPGLFVFVVRVYCFLFLLREKQENSGKNSQRITSCFPFAVFFVASALKTQRHFHHWIRINLNLGPHQCQSAQSRILMANLESFCWHGVEKNRESCKLDSFSEVCRGW